MKDLRDIAVFAFRYSLGRRTFAPYIVTGFIKEHLDEFFNHDLDQMAYEIDEHKSLYGDLGDSRIDEPDWIQFRDFLKKEVEKRKEMGYNGPNRLEL